MTAEEIAAVELDHEDEKLLDQMEQEAATRENPDIQAVGSWARQL